jgi:gluconolactonase
VTSKPEIVVTDIEMPEGPVWCRDGTLVCTSVSGAKLWRIWPEEGRKEVVADTAGGANSAQLASDGGFVVTQNGGIDFTAMGIPGEWSPVRRVSGGLQRVHPDGTVTYLVDHMQAPNDLVVGPEGTVYFTNPRKFPAPPGSRDSNVMAYRTDGSVELVADDFVFCNGIAIDIDGNLCVTEENGLMRINPDGSKEWIVENLSVQHAADGFCLDQNGVFYLAGSLDHGVRIVEDRREIGFLPIPGDGGTTNCCFGGPDNRWLFATDGLPGQVVVWEDMPTPGMPMHLWPAPTDEA